MSAARTHLCAVLRYLRQYDPAGDPRFDMRQTIYTWAGEQTPHQNVLPYAETE